ncbi:hypothetical protein AAG570_002482 [Ranatra chinensis]|uniref:Reverse transcriptase domain-containing protein n=1 Tax=Ranatra chinensis TaxID=642074 RepID=A0ABD0YJY0_9HEMI
MIMIDWVSIVRHSRRRFSNYMYAMPTKVRKRRRKNRRLENMPRCGSAQQQQPPPKQQQQPQLPLHHQRSEDRIEEEEEEEEETMAGGVCRGSRRTGRRPPRLRPSRCCCCCFMHNAKRDSEARRHRGAAEGGSHDGAPGKTSAAAWMRPTSWIRVERGGRTKVVGVVHCNRAYHRLEGNLRDKDAGLESTAGGRGNAAGSAGAPETCFSLVPISIAFQFGRGKYEFTRMPFGLKNAPSTFQRLIGEFLEGLNEDAMQIYMDDIVYSRFEHEQGKNLQQLLQKFKEFGLRASDEKSSFFKPSVHFMSCPVRGPTPIPIR